MIILENEVLPIEKFANCRNSGFDGEVDPSKYSTISKEVIRTLIFNEHTKWPQSVGNYPHELLSSAKNPGLGIRELHAQGITGHGVTAAIIDQPMFPTHPEFKGQIKQYIPAEVPYDSSYHGPAVASLLVGKDIGVAPQAELIYVATPGALKTATAEITALAKLIEINESLPTNNKIRVVSVSAAPFEREGGNPAWFEMVKKANEAGIMVLDVSSIIAPGHFTADNRETVDSFEFGFAHRGRFLNQTLLYAPTAPRTIAEHYEVDSPSYSYGGTGGLSWAIPYVAGVMCLGWQIAPQTTYSNLFELIINTASIKEGCKIINPIAFITAVKNMKA
jgi:hypothetical protein